MSRLLAIVGSELSLSKLLFRVFAISMILFICILAIVNFHVTLTNTVVLVVLAGIPATLTLSAEHLAQRRKPMKLRPQEVLRASSVPGETVWSNTLELRLQEVVATAVASASKAQTEEIQLLKAELVKAFKVIENLKKDSDLIEPALRHLESVISAPGSGQSGTERQTLQVVRAIQLGLPAIVELAVRRAMIPQTAELNPSLKTVMGQKGRSEMGAEQLNALVWDLVLTDVTLPRFDITGRGTVINTSPQAIQSQVLTPMELVQISVDLTYAHERRPLTPAVRKLAANILLQMRPALKSFQIYVLEGIQTARTYGELAFSLSTNVASISKILRELSQQYQMQSAQRRVEGQALEYSDE